MTDETTPPSDWQPSQKTGEAAKVWLAGRGVELAEGEEVLLWVRPSPPGTPGLYIVTLGLWEFWRRATSYTLTNQRIIKTKGIVSKTDSSLPLFYVQDAHLKTWPFPAVGRVLVSTAGRMGGFTGTLSLRQEDARQLRDGILQGAKRARETGE